MRSLENSQSWIFEEEIENSFIHTATVMMAKRSVFFRTMSPITLSITHLSILLGKSTSNNHEMDWNMEIQNTELMRNHWNVFPLCGPIWSFLSERKHSFNSMVAAMFMISLHLWIISFRFFIQHKKMISFNM